MRLTMRQCVTPGPVSGGKNRGSIEVPPVKDVKLAMPPMLSKILLSRFLREKGNNRRKLPAEHPPLPAAICFFA